MVLHYEHIESKVYVLEYFNASVRESIRFQLDLERLVQAQLQKRFDCGLNT